MQIEITIKGGATVHLHGNAASDVLDVLEQYFKPADLNDPTADCEINDEGRTIETPTSVEISN